MLQQRSGCSMTAALARSDRRGVWFRDAVAQAAAGFGCGNGFKDGVWVSRRRSLLGDIRA